MDEINPKNRTVKLKPIKGDQDAYDRLWGDPENFARSSNITQNYLFFYNEIQKQAITIDQLFKAVEKLQDNGFVAWKTDREAGRTYVELSSKAVELMAEERAFMQRCYVRLRAELGDEELHRAVSTMQSVTAILKDEREHSGV